MKKLIPFLLLFLPTLAWPASQAVPGFRGLHDSESAMLIKDDEAQAIRDVDITDSGNGIRKRDGYTSFKTIGISTHGVRGGYYFRDVDGSDHIVHANETDVYSSELGAAYSAFITTDTSGSYYDFADSQGFLYRTTNNRDQFVRYDGTTLTYYPSAPKGDQFEVLPDRGIISGTTANPNRLHFSAAADLTNYTIGSQEADPYTEDFGLPGQDVNATKVACGSDVMVWTRDTLSQYSGTNQYDGNITQISNTVGTVQPNSVIQDFGITYWQAQDGHFYAYDCNGVSQISRALSVDDFASGDSRLFVITSESDWTAGTVGVGLSATTNSGDVTKTLIVHDAFTDGNFSSNPVWTDLAGSADVSPSASGGGVLFTNNAGVTGDAIEFIWTSDPNTTDVGYWEMEVSDWDATGDQAGLSISNSATPSGLTSAHYTAFIERGAANTGIYLYEDLSTILSSATIVTPSSGFTIGISRTSGNVLTVYLNRVSQLTATDSTYTSFPSLLVGGGGAIGGGDVSIDDVTYTVFGPTYYVSASQSLGNISSWGFFSETSSADGGTLTYAIYSDTNTSKTITNGIPVASSFVSSQVITNGSFPTIAIDDYVFFSVAYTNTDIESDMRSSEISIRWNEGSSVRTFGTVDKDHRLLWSIAEGTNTAPNTTYIYDPRFDSWLKYSVPFDAPARVGDLIYFGNPGAGNVYTWPSGTDDNGSAITAYWKSKDFISGDPFVEKDFLNYSLIANEDIGSNLAVTYTINLSSSITNSHTLTDPAGTDLRRINAKLPSGKFGTFISFQFGNDDANAPFELYGFKYDYTLRPWRVMQ